MKHGIKWLKNRGRADDLALFLDFDGTLAPIVERPGDARPLEGIPELIERIGRHLPVAVISGRGLDDVSDRLGNPSIYIAGSHGMEIRPPQGPAEADERVESLLPVLDEEETRLREHFSEVPRVEIERKRFGIAVHFRRRPEAREIVEKAIEESIDRHPKLKMGTGKMVRELQPDVDVDKGTALQIIRERIDASQQWALYVGDDRTDEDAFEAVADDGAGILVAEEPRSSAARYWLRDPGEVRRFLEGIDQLLGADGSGGAPGT